VTGWPGLSVPAGYSASGVPLGVQLLGPANAEATLISLAAQLEAQGAMPSGGEIVRRLSRG
jgi:amidase